MIPLSSDFLMLYGLYISILLLLILGIRSDKFRKQAVWHFVFYFLYSCLMFVIFLDPNSFIEGQTSLVLYYGYVFPMLHFMAFAIVQFFMSFRKK